MSEVIGCNYYSSVGVEEGDKLRSIKSVISKEAVVKSLKGRLYKVVFIGDGRNDAEAIKAADWGIAASYVKKAALEAAIVADMEVMTEEEAIDAIMRFQSSHTKLNEHLSQKF